MTSRRLRRLIRRDSSTHRVHIVATAVDKTEAAAVIVVFVVLKVDFLAGNVGHSVLRVVVVVVVADLHDVRFALASAAVGAAAVVVGARATFGKVME